MLLNSSSIKDTLTPDDPEFWRRPTPADCNIVRSVGILLCIAIVVGFAYNGIIFYNIVRHKALRSASNIFVMFTAFIGLLASCTIFPLTGTSSVYCYWLYGRSGCIFDAVIAFLYGCASPYLLCGLSVCRCYMIIRPLKAKDITVGKSILLSLLLILFAFLWTAFPLMGWNEYTLEGARISCCINWFDRRPSYIAYIFFMFLFVYFIPLGVLLATNVITLMGLKQMRENIERGIKTSYSKKRIEMERRIIKNILFTTAGFFISWTPYAITLFLSALRGREYALSPLTTFFSACFAKSSVIWIPALYIHTSTQFQFRFVNFQDAEQPMGTNRIEDGVTNRMTVAPKQGETKTQAVNRAAADSSVAEGDHN